MTDSVTVNVYRIDEIAVWELRMSQPQTSNLLSVANGVAQQPYATFTCEKMRVEDNKERHFIVSEWEEYTQKELDDCDEERRVFMGTGSFHVVGTYSRKIFAYTMEKDDDNS